jgi:hypothetical protein
MPVKEGTDDERETMPVRWTVYRIQLKMRVDYGDKTAQADLQIARTATTDN